MNLKFLVATLILSLPAFCDTSFLSFTGSLATPQTDFEQVFFLSSTSNVQIQTWSFGGGTNAAGSPIPAGGFDPLIALFSSSGAAAAIVLDPSLNPEADADTLTNFAGNCPPAGMVTIGSGAGSSVCGDDLLTISNLAAGAYTLVLADANYTPFAVNPGPPVSSLLSDGFADNTGGIFETCNFPSGGMACITPANNYAVDIVDQSGPGLSTTPEPSSFGLILCGIGAIASLRRKLETTK